MKFIRNFAGDASLFGSKIPFPAVVSKSRRNAFFLREIISFKWVWLLNLLN